MAAVPDEAIDDLKARLARTRWPDPETVSDWSQGVRSDNLRRLLQRWEHDYDWRDFESRLNGHPQFLTEIDGVDIHFVHVRSPHTDALPLILTHGWPSSVIDFSRLVGPLTDPVAYGGSADDAFDVVIPSLPGFGFSGKPALFRTPLASDAARGGESLDRVRARRGTIALSHQVIDLALNGPARPGRRRESELVWPLIDQLFDAGDATPWQSDDGNT
ncbi:epoxide hydrolase family protein [Microbacterium lacticum]